MVEKKFICLKKVKESAFSYFTIIKESFDSKKQW